MPKYKVVFDRTRSYETYVNASCVEQACERFHDGQTTEYLLLDSSDESIISVEFDSAEEEEA